MIRAIVGVALRFRFLIVAAAILAMAIGISQIRSASVDTLPEFTPPYIEIQTEALGLSADEVEQLVTVGLEADLLNGVEGVEVIRSKSLAGLSSIVLVFKPDADLYRSRALVQERLAQVGAVALPNVSKPPVMLQPYSSSSRVMIFGLSSDKLSPIEKSVIARWTVRPRLLGVPGVANVAIWGFRDRQLQVQVDPKQLREKGVTLQQVVASTGNAQIATPLSFLEGSTPGTGGFIETPQQRLGVRHVFDKLTSPAELAKVPVEGTGGALRLGDVSRIVEDHQPLIGDAVVNDREGDLLLVVEKLPGASTLTVTRGVEKALNDLSPGLGGMRPDTTIFRPATFIEKAKDNLTLVLVIGGILMALALAAFLFQLRTLLICLFAIPMSLVTAALVLDLMGETFNAISFAGLAAALVVVIDEGVVSAENVARRLRRHREVGSDMPTQDIVQHASSEVRSPLMYATIIAVLAIVPVAVMGGRPGAFFEPLVLAYALAVAAAMVVALIVTPALSLLLFSRGPTPRRESPILAALAPRYQGLLSRVISRPRAVLVAAAVALGVAVVVLPLLGKSPIPTLKDGNVLVRLDAEPGTSNARMTAIATQVSKDLRSIAGVDNVGAQVGRAIGGDELVDVNTGVVWASIDPDADYDATRASIKDAVATVDGARADVVTYSEQKIRDVGGLREGENPVTGDGLNVLTGSAKPLVVRVYGQEFDALRREAGKVQTLMSQIDGVVDPRIDLPVQQPNILIEVDLDKARPFGIKPGDVRRAEAALVQGLTVGSVFEQQKVFEVIVLGTPEIRQDLADIRNLQIDTPDGGSVRLGQVADVRVSNRPIAVERDAVSRYLDIEAGVSGRSLDAVAGEIEDRLRDSVFPLEYHAQVLTSQTGDETNTWLIVVAAIAAVLAVILLLQAAFKSWRLAALAFLMLPVALAGAAVAALVNGAELSLGALIGILAVFALAARSGLVQIRRYQDLERFEGETFGADLVRRGSHERLGPVLTTTVAMAMITLVIIILGTRPGLEIINPMAIVILGGLVTTMLMSLFVLPTLYLRFAGHPPILAPEEAAMDDHWLDVEPAAAGAAGTGDGHAPERDSRRREANMEPEQATPVTGVGTVPQPADGDDGPQPDGNAGKDGGEPA
jgi:Cu/Ag efflux pump CusA